MTGESELIDIAADLTYETEKAFLISDGGKPVWVPKSYVENNGDGTWTMPLWLAKDKGLV